MTVWRYCTEIFDYLSLSAIIDGKVGWPRGSVGMGGMGEVLGLSLPSLLPCSPL